MSHYRPPRLAMIVSMVDHPDIRDLLTRLARPHPSGGKVIERAAILAEGGDFPEVIEWIIDHEGAPEAAAASNRAAPSASLRAAGRSLGLRASAKPRAEVG